MPIKDSQQLVLAKRTGLQPFPALPAFTVAITVLKYAGTQASVMQLLQRASHTTRAYCFHHKASLDQLLIKQIVNVDADRALQQTESSLEQC